MKSSNINRLIGLALTAVLLLSLFFGWIGLSGEFKRMMRVEDMDKKELVENIEDLDDKIRWLAGFSSDKSTSNKMINAAEYVVKSLSDLVISPVELGKIASKGGFMIRNMDDELKTLAGAMSFAGFVFGVLFWGLLVSSAAILVSAVYPFKKVRAAQNVQTAFAGLLFLVLLIAVAVANSKLSDLRELFDIGSVIAITAWPVIGIICAIGSRLLYKPEGAAAGVSAARIPTFGDAIGMVSKGMGSLRDAGEKIGSMWVCPNCKKTYPATNRFCGNCGCKKPEPKRCACGVILTDDERFCHACGKPVAGANTGRPVSTPKTESANSADDFAGQVRATIEDAVPTEPVKTAAETTTTTAASGCFAPPSDDDL